MDAALNAVYEALVDSLYIDVKKAKRLSVEQIKRFKSFFAMEIEEPGLFYNGLNLIITDAPTFAELEAFLQPSRITTRVEIKEHNLFVVVYPYFNDALIKQALDKS